MGEIAIKVENLSKAYQLGQIGTGTVSNDIQRWWATKIRGKEDPFLKIGEANDRSVKGVSDIVWSLKDINFEITQGDAVGIIGRNGAGKSTLLKLLSRVTAPTTGNIKIKGRIASLLEVGTGFHPELTGRENIYLNGAILGMRKKEITRKFDEIVDFSGVERYIDTPVKRYSSGMYVRLAFAVAAHLESEILIVDEVLAVGDAEFQKKCLGKMGEVSKGEGRTVLFVSHNLISIKSLCSNSIFLEHGQLKRMGDTNSIVDFYNESTYFNGGKLKYGFGVESLLHSASFDKNKFDLTEELIFKLVFNVNIEFNSYMISFDILNSDSYIINSQRCYLNELTNQNNSNSIVCTFPKNILNEGNYYVNIYIFNSKAELVENHKEILQFEILEKNRNESYLGRINGCISIPMNFNIQ
jgi:lipopolysaccharide transport system ATP-binding protein